MDGVITAYVSLIAKLEEEYEEIPGCIQGELLGLYQKILTEEKEIVTAKSNSMIFKGYGNYALGYDNH